MPSSSEPSSILDSSLNSMNNSKLLFGRSIQSGSVQSNPISNNMSVNLKKSDNRSPFGLTDKSNSRSKLDEHTMQLINTQGKQKMMQAELKDS